MEAMKLSMIKSYGGTLVPAGDIESEIMTKFANGEMCEVEIKTTRNPAFHRKMFAFFKFCREYYDCRSVHEFVSNAEQHDRFRKDLTILAGFYDVTTRLNGEQRLEAKSLKESNMSPEQFEECYKALVNAAMKHIFKDCGPEIENRLLSFF